MKKLFFAAAGLLVLASCKADYDCTCNNANGNTASETYTDIKKDDAETLCASRQANLKYIDATYTCSTSKK